MIEWFARNPVAANLLMFGIVFAGILSATTSVPVESFPSRETNQIVIITDFRGATPSTSEEGVTIRIEEAIADIEGIEEISSRSSEGRSSVTVEITQGYEPRDLLDDIKVRVDALNTLPREAEKPVVSIRVFNRPVLNIALFGDVGNKTLRELAQQFREGLLATGEISDVSLQGVANYEISIEASPEKLDDYNLSLDQLGRAIRAGARDISAGNIQTRDGDILIRSDGQAYSAQDYARIPIIPNTQGSAITLGEIAKVIDGFEEKSLITRFNGQPAVLIDVRRVGSQSALQVSALSSAYIEQFSRNLPSGVKIEYWENHADYLESRIGAVLNSALMGGILVMIMLSLFLRPAVAFWVFLGIPVSFMGAFLFMPQVGGTFNVMSLFAFIMVLGIVVDDAIVTGENIYRKIREGIDPLQASIVGTKEITVPVTFGILTTVAAFLPLHFMGGTRYDFVASQMPMVVIPVMLMSLVESKLVLPSHMSHIKMRDPNAAMSLFGRTQQAISRGLENFVVTRYQPFLQRCLSNKAVTITSALSICAIVIAYTYFGHTRYSPRPDIESEVVRIYLTMPESTGFETTHGHIEHIRQQMEALQEKYSDPKTGESAIKNILTTSGSSDRNIGPNLGTVQARLQTAGQRIVDVKASQIAREVRKMVGDIPGATSLSVRAGVFRFNAPIDIELSGASPRKMSEVIALLKTKLNEYPGVFDVQDNYSGGKEELNIKLKPRAYSLGLNLTGVAQQVRNAVFGFQAQRIQRGRDELRVMVRYPLEHRSSVDDLLRLPIRVPNSSEEVLLSEIAEVEPFESPTTLYRLNRTSVINITADVDPDVTSSALVLADLDSYLIELQQSFSDLQFRYDGEAEDTAKTNSKLSLGLVLVLISIYALLAIPFKSYGQPLIVMSMIPPSLIGAILGHIITGQNLSVMSIFGMLALVGVVVNDSLVLVNYINVHRQRGEELVQAVVKAATMRFRPVLLTSLTTFAGLAPILLDTSLQAKWLKPMATSLAFGILFAALLTLLIVPVNYILAHKFKHFTAQSGQQLWHQWLAFWNREDEPRRRI